MTAPAGRRVAAAILVAAALIGGAAAAAAQGIYRGQPFNPTPVYQPAQPPYRAQPSVQPPLPGVPAAPPAWNYDPYTDGTVPTPHGGSG